MTMRANRMGRRARGVWTWLVCAVCSLAIGGGPIAGAARDVADDAIVEPADGTGTHSLSLSAPIVTLDSAVRPDAPTVAGCPITILPNDNATSVNERAPNLRNRFARQVYLVKATELAAAGLTAGTGISGIGWSFSTAPGIGGSNNLIVYLQNTTDTTNLKSLVWATAIGDMTVVHDAATTIPNVTGPFDITFSGGSAFTYTGDGLYVAFDAPYPVGTLSTATGVWCNSTGLINGILGAQSNTSNPTTLTANSFRPETRLTPSVASVVNDASVDFVISLGSLPQPLVGPQTVQAVVTNRGVNPRSNLPVTFNLTGAETFTNTQTVASMAACGGRATVTFDPFTPAVIGSDTVTVTVPADDFSGNNSRSRPLDETFNLYSYKHPGTTPSGGVGLTGATGAFVGKFTITAGTKVSAVHLEFFAASSTTYRVAIYPDSGSGTPGLVPLYLDAADRTVAAAGPVTITLPSPVAVGPGNFYAGIQQTNTTNASLSFDNESPVRAGAFYRATPNPPTTWLDFAPGNNYKPNIGVTLAQCASAAECNDGNVCTDDACTNNLCVHVNNSLTSCDGNSCSNPDHCLNGTCIPGPDLCDDHDACTVDVCDGQGGCSHNALDCDDHNPCTGDFCLPGSGCAHNDSAPPAVQFCNGDGIAILDSVAPTIASPYPSTITVAAQGSYLCSVTVTLNGITHAFPDDIDILLEHLAGPGAIIMSDVGASEPASGVDLTFDDSASTSLGTTLVSGTFKPTNMDGAGTESWPAPAPAPPAAPGSALSTFIGRDPNGPWNLWVVDDFAGDEGTMSGWCLNVASVCGPNGQCDDGNPCTDDACVNARCTHTNNTGACNDNNACTANDACSGGVCVGGAAPACDDGNPCTANTCNPSTGQCEHPAVVCNDNNTCTNDTCDAATGCVFTPNTNACNDNNSCTSPDVCQDGVCVGLNPVVCTPDANVCTTEACNPATGACVSTNNTNACDDGNACTIGDVCGPALSESFDAVTVPSLPGTWSSSVSGAGAAWSTANTSSDTAPNSAFGLDGPAVADEALISPPINVATPTATLTFRNRWSFESPTDCFDGGVLEISIAGGAFMDIVTAGGSFVSGGYSGAVLSSSDNPLAGRQAWCGASAGYPAYVTTVVTLPAAAAGQTIQLRWRIGTDSTIAAAGQNIDSLVLVDGANTCKSGTPITAPPETHNLAAASDKTTYNWSAATFATRYDAVRGSIAELPAGPGGGDEVCFDNLAGTTLVDPATPGSGMGFWYLSRGENSCGNGTYGAQGVNGGQGAPRITSTCP